MKSIDIITASFCLVFIMLSTIYILKQNCAKCRGFKSSRSSLWLTLRAGLDVIGLEDFIDICGCAAEANYHTVTDRQLSILHK